MADGNEVTIDGRQTDIVDDKAGITVKTWLEPGQEMEIRIKCTRPGELISRLESRPMYQARVFIRRRLSEFRDNYLARNPFAFRKAQSSRAR